MRIHLGRSKRSHVGLTLISMLCCLGLAGCGGGTSFADTYEAEKARLRSAIPSSIVCEERSPTWMSCVEDDAVFVYMQDVGSSLRTSIGIDYVNATADKSLMLPQVLALYGLSRTEIDDCNARKETHAQLKTLEYACGAGFDPSSGIATLKLVITQRKLI